MDEISKDNEFKELNINIEDIKNKNIKSQLINTNITLNDSKLDSNIASIVESFPEKGCDINFGDEIKRILSPTQIKELNSQINM